MKQSLSRRAPSAALALAFGLTLVANAFAGDEPPALSPETLAVMGYDELEALYRAAAPSCAGAAIPCGYLPGRAIYCSTEKLSKVKSAVSAVSWKGKHFSSDEPILVNQWLVGKAVKANVLIGESWMDGRPAIVMDYQGTSSLVWRNVRDEVREVAPGLYLGAMFQRGRADARFRMFFVLEARPAPPRER